MKGHNQLDPSMMHQAHLLGQQRMPTEAEKKAYEKNALTIAILNISATAQSALIEGKHGVDTETCFELAKALLDKSEATKDDYKDTQKRKMRNQLAAQFMYARCRGTGITSTPENIVEEAFSHANELFNMASAYAENEVETTDIIT